MGAGTSLVVFAIGAIMRFAISATSRGFNIHGIGIILMVVGGIGFLVSLAFWSSWGGFGGTSRHTTTTGGGATTTTTTTQGL